MLYPTLSVGYAMFLVAVARATYERRHGTAFGVAALFVALVSLLSIPSTWGVSSFLAVIGLPLSLPGLFVRGRARRLSLVALPLNAAAAVLLAWLW